MPYIEEHIIFKELKAVRGAIQAFLPELKGRRTPRQPFRHRRPHPPHLQVPHDDVRAPKTIPLDRHLRHQDPDSVHPERGKCMNKQCVPRHGQLRLADGTTEVETLQQEVGSPHD